jgi:hypothetical protein
VDRILADVTDTIRVSQDFANQLLMIELLIIQQVYKINGAPVLEFTMNAEKANNYNQSSLF